MSESRIRLESRGGFLFLRAAGEHKNITAAFAARPFLKEDGPEFINFGFSGTIEGAATARKNLCGALGMNFENLTCGEQVHGVNVAVVDREVAGSGAGAPEMRIPATDALVTNLSGVPLAIMTADCVPVLYAAEDGSAIGAAHAGWRSALAGIAEKTLAVMEKTFGTPPGKVHAYLGPSIGQCCFQVREDVTGLLKEREAKYLRADAGGNTFLDLRGAVAERLRDAGIGSVTDSGACTKCNTNLFYSYRGDLKVKGSNISIISING